MSDTPGAGQPPRPGWPSASEGDEGRAVKATADRIEMFSAILLGLAATLTAFSAYVSAIAGGEELEAFNTASATLTDANFFFQRGIQTVATDNQLFVAYLERIEAGEDTFFLTELMRPELQAAIDDWHATEPLLTPFESDAYFVEDFDTGQDLQSQSEAALVRAGDEGDRGDLLDLANVVFAVALFAAGVLNLFKRPGLQYLLVGVAAVMILGGTAVTLSAM